MQRISIRAARITLLLLGAVALLCLLFPPVYAIDFPGIPDGFGFVGSLRPEDQVVQWLLGLELAGVAAMTAWLGTWLLQQRPTPARVRTQPPGFGHGHGRSWRPARA